MPYNYKTELQRYRKYYQSLEPSLDKPKSRAYTAIIFSFLAISLFGWYAIRPTVETILYLRREIVDETDVNSKMDDKISALITAQATYQEVQPILPAIDDALPNMSQAIPLAQTLRNLASASGTQIASLQIATVPLTGGTATPSAETGGTKALAKNSAQQSFDLSVAVRGSYDQIRSFYAGVVSMRRIATVNSASITSIRAETISSASAQLNDTILQLALKLKGYYLGQ